MHANKDEAARCIGIAQRAWSQGNAKKAIKFLNKSIQLCDNQQARQLLQQYTSQPPSAQAQQQQQRQQPQQAHASPRQSRSQQQQQQQHQQQHQQQSQQSRGQRSQRSQRAKPNTNQSHASPNRSQQQQANHDGNANTNPNGNGNGNGNGPKIDWGNYFNMGNSPNNSSSNLGRSASGSSSSSNNSNSTPRTPRASRGGAASASSSRMTADEEVQMIRKILRSKDYYEMLGVDRNADEKQLKKKYRKLAFKLHPDRNKAPGAEEAFKKLSAAYDCLRDERKRNYYDQYGTEQPSSRGGAQFQQMTPEDIMRMFFGGDFAGGPRGGGSHFFYAGPGGFSHHQHRRRRSQDDEDGGGRGGLLFTLMQLLPLLFVMLSMFLPTLLNSMGSNGSSLGQSRGSQWEGQHFSLTKNRVFSRQDETNLGTKFYLRNKNNMHWGYNPTRNRPQLEEQVELSYLNYLINECKQENKLYSQNLEKVKSSDMSNKQRIKMLDTLQKSFKHTGSSSFSGHIFNSQYKGGNGNGKMCNKLDEYLESLS